MKTAVAALALLAMSAHGGNIEQVLDAAQVDADAETFLPDVTWLDNPETAYYRCTSRGDRLVGELWRGPTSSVRTPHSPLESVRYGEHGPIKVFNYTDGKRAVFMMLPSGETHLFRYSSSQKIVKASMEWQCAEAPYQAPESVGAEGGS